MASAAYFILTVLVSSTLTQAYTVSQTDIILSKALPALYNDKELSSIRATFPECFQTFVIAVYVAYNSWEVKNDWFAIADTLKEELEHCATLQNEEEKKGCTQTAEAKAWEGKKGIFRATIGLSIAAVTVGFKAKSACFA